MQNNDISYISYKLPFYKYLKVLITNNLLQYHKTFNTNGNISDNKWNTS